MKDESKSKKQFINELSALRKKISELEKTETKNKKNIESLKESEERYKALFNRSIFSVYIHDFEGNFLDANDTALNLLGYTREEIPSQNLSTVLAEDQIAKALKIIEETKKTGFQKTPIEFKVRKKNGELIWMETEGTVIFKSGKPYAILGIARDITKRKHTENELQKIKDRLGFILSTAPVALYTSKTSGDYGATFISGSIKILLGYTQEEFTVDIPVHKNNTLT